MKKLPNIYKNENVIPINNNKKSCYLENESVVEKQSLDITEKLNIIFNGMGYSYNIAVVIKTKDKEYHTSLVARTKNNLVTLDNDVIPIKDIISLEIK